MAPQSAPAPETPAPGTGADTEAPVLAVSGVAAGGRPGGLVLVGTDGSLEWIDEVDSGALASDARGVARVLRGAGGDRVARYDSEGLLAIDRADDERRLGALAMEAGGVLAELLPEGAHARLATDGSWAAADPTAPGTMRLATGFEDEPVAMSAHAGLLAGLLGSEAGAVLALVDPATGAERERVEIPMGTPAGIASIPPTLAEGLRVGGRVSPFRVQETEQARAFAAAGVKPSGLWASGAPLAVPDCHVEIEVDNPMVMAPGARVQVAVRLRNLGGAILVSGGAHPVFLATRWRDPETTAELTDVVTLRSPLARPVPPGGTLVDEMTLVAPERPGTFHIQITLLQERIRWLSDVDDRTAHWAVVVVSDGGDGLLPDGTVPA